MIYRFDDFELNDLDFCLFRAGQRVSLEPRALRVLLLFVENPGKLLQKSSILESVWSNTFVEESTLTRAITILRKRLGDDPRAPTYIETVPTLGYRFIAKVEVSSQTDRTGTQAAAMLPSANVVPVMQPDTQAPGPAPGSAPGPEEDEHKGQPLPPSGEPPGADSLSPGQSRRPIKTRYWILLLILLLAAGGSLLWWKVRSRPVRGEKQTIVISDFDNATGDPVFDGTLREGITVQLEQSPVLSLVSDQRIRSTLLLMNQPVAPA